MFPFHDKKNAAALSCIHVIAEGKPILYASHDEDGTWQFLCGNDDEIEDALVLALDEMYYRDKTIAGVANIPSGYFAERIDIKSEWIVYKNIFDEE